MYYLTVGIISIFLSSCGGSSNSGISGVAVDGYLAGSTVCLDMNSNGSCQPFEPSTTTESDGSYFLYFSDEDKLNANFSTSSIIVIGGIDVGSDLSSPKNTAFTGILKAPNVGTVVNITPITTVISSFTEQEKSNNPNISTAEFLTKNAEISSKLRTVYGLGVNDSLTVDIAKNGNENLMSKALEMQKAFEVMVDASISSGDKTDVKQTMSSAYKAFMIVVDDSSVNTSVSDLIDNIFTNTDSSSILPNSAKKVKDRAKQISENIKSAFSTSTSSDYITKLNNIEKMIDLEIKAVKNDFLAFDFNSSLAVFSTTTITTDIATFIAKNSSEMQDFLFTENLKLLDGFSDMGDTTLKAYADKFKDAITINDDFDISDLFNEDDSQKLKILLDRVDLGNIENYFTDSDGSPISTSVESSNSFQNIDAIPNLSVSIPTI